MSKIVATIPMIKATPGNIGNIVSHRSTIRHKMQASHLGNNKDKLDCQECKGEANAQALWIALKTYLPRCSLVPSLESRISVVE